MATRAAFEKAYLFRGAAPADLDAVAALAQEVALGAGETVTEIGDGADAFFVIEFGSVDLRMRDHENVLITMTSGQPFADEAFFDHDRGVHNSTAVTHEPTHVLRVGFADFERLLAARPALALVVYRNAAAFYAHAMRSLAREVTHRMM